MQRTAAAEAWLTIAQKRMAALHNEIEDLCIRYNEAVTVSKESREKLAALIKCTHRD
jgi:hypothetical protein